MRSSVSATTDQPVGVRGYAELGWLVVNGGWPAPKVKPPPPSKTVDTGHFFGGKAFGRQIVYLASFADHHPV